MLRDVVVGSTKLEKNKDMKKTLRTLVCTAAVVLLGTSPALAKVETDPAAVAADAVIGRPLCLATTVLGCAAFVVALPFAATSGSISSTADALVVKPAKATFTRPLGDFGNGESPTTPAVARGKTAKNRS
jgi:hypothetical protein